MPIRICVARERFSLTALAKLLIPLFDIGEQVVDLPSLARHLIEDEFDARSQTEPCPTADAGTQTAFRTFQGFGCPFARSPLVMRIGQLGPIDVGNLKVARYPDFGDRDALEAGIANVSFKTCRDHPLDEPGNARLAG